MIVALLALAPTKDGFVAGADGVRGCSIAPWDRGKPWR